MKKWSAGRCMAPCFMNLTIFSVSCLQIGQWDDEETLEHICGNLPKCYDAVIEPLEKRIGHEVDPLTIIELREDLNQKYLKLNPTSVEEDTNERKEIGLFAGGFKGSDISVANMATELEIAERLH